MKKVFLIFGKERVVSYFWSPFEKRMFDGCLEVGWLKNLEIIFGRDNLVFTFALPKR
jgi:hypothetical protein